MYSHFRGLMLFVPSITNHHVKHDFHEIHAWEKKLSPGPRLDLMLRREFPMVISSSSY